MTMLDKNGKRIVVPKEPKKEPPKEAKKEKK